MDTWGCSLPKNTNFDLPGINTFFDQDTAVESGGIDQPFHQVGTVCAFTDSNRRTQIGMVLQIAGSPQPFQPGLTTDWQVIFDHFARRRKWMEPPGCDWPA